VGGNALRYGGAAAIVGDMNMRCCFGVVAALVVASVSVQAGDTDQPPSGHNALRKLGRGCANVLFGVVEVPNQVTKATAAHGGAATFTYGLSKGIVRWFARAGVGVYEIITFPLPFPRGYQPVMKPEFPNEDYEP